MWIVVAVILLSTAFARPVVTLPDTNSAGTSVPCETSPASFDLSVIDSSLPQSTIHALPRPPSFKDMRGYQIYEEEQKPVSLPFGWKRLGPSIVA